MSKRCSLIVKFSSKIVQAFARACDCTVKRFTQSQVLSNYCTFDLSTYCSVESQSRFLVDLVLWLVGWQSILT